VSDGFDGSFDGDARASTSQPDREPGKVPHLTRSFRVAGSRNPSHKESPEGYSRISPFWGTYPGSQKQMLVTTVLRDRPKANDIYRTEECMYIFTRTRTMNSSDPRAARDLAVQMANTASKVIGQPITAFENRFGEPGALTWSTRVNDMAELDDLTAKLTEDPTYLKLLDQARPMFSLPTDRLTQVLSSSVTSATVSRFYASTVAVAAPGKLGAAVAYGIRVQDHVAKAGFTGMFGSSVFGSYGELGWLLAADSMAELDRFRAFQTTDAAFIKLADDAGPLFVPSSGVNRLVSRI
jgi:hypothetical protein